MPRIEYKTIAFHAATEVLILTCDGVIQEYAGQGYNLTLRQLYYQLVARDLIPNTQRAYAKLSRTVSDARLAGLIDWNAIVDRTRAKRELASWDSPKGVLHSAYASYHRDWWDGQANYVEVWVEKDALIGVISQACNTYDVPYFACRGYVSQSAMWRAAKRFIAKGNDYKDLYLLHFGDHDPSGMDMTRDIQDRLELFGAYVAVERIALNWDQIAQYNPPPNPAKLSDSRAGKYVEQYGYDSWELDALQPATITDLIHDRVIDLIAWGSWEKVQEIEKEEKRKLKAILDRYE